MAAPYGKRAKTHVTIYCESFHNFAPSLRGSTLSIRRPHLTTKFRSLALHMFALKCLFLLISVYTFVMQHTATQLQSNWNLAKLWVGVHRMSDCSSKAPFCLWVMIQQLGCVEPRHGITEKVDQVYHFLWSVVEWHSQINQRCWNATYLCRTIFCLRLTYESEFLIISCF